MESVMYTPKNYGPAICLALNHGAGGLEIHDYIYDEDKDLWFVELTEHNDFYISAFQLRGYLVRSCFKAIKRGVVSWRAQKP